MRPFRISGIAPHSMGRRGPLRWGQKAAASLFVYCWPGWSPEAWVCTTPPTLAPPPPHWPFPVMYLHTLGSLLPLYHTCKLPHFLCGTSRLCFNIILSYTMLSPHAPSLAFCAATNLYTCDLDCLCSFLPIRQCYSSEIPFSTEPFTPRASTHASDPGHLSSSNKSLFNGAFSDLKACKPPLWTSGLLHMCFYDGPLLFPNKVITCLSVLSPLHRKCLMH